MPSFGASQSLSGPRGLNSGPHSKMAMRIAGVSKFETRGVGNRTGPKQTDPTFNSQRDKFRQFWIISGVTKDGETDTPLGFCAVHLFDTANDTEIAETVSDASGNYSFSVPGNSATNYVVAYKANAPDVTGATANTLFPVLR